MGWEKDISAGQAHRGVERKAIPECDPNGDAIVK
jgi:hypothetical protein